MNPLPAINARFDAVVIGGSAGAAEMLGILLPALPERMRAAVLIVLHLPRDRPSQLAALFARRCAVRCIEAQDKDPVEGGCVYFAPPDYHLLVDAGPSLALSTDALVSYSRPSIDVTFESAAEAWGERLFAVLLSGANEDGARGLRAIRHAGGIAVVQDPAQAKSPAMPRAGLRLVPEASVASMEQLARLFSEMEIRP